MNLMNKAVALMKIGLVLFLSCGIMQAQFRSFVHPGITYTQGDLDRMKAMVEAKQEPYYSTFLKLKEYSYYSLNT